MRFVLPFAAMETSLSATQGWALTVFLLLLIFVLTVWLILSTRRVSRYVRGLEQFSRRLAGGDFRPLPAGDLRSSSGRADKLLVKAGDTLHYTFVLRNSGSSLKLVKGTDSLPPELQFAGNLRASSGTASQAGGGVSWQGANLTNQGGAISFDASLDAGLTGYHAIRNKLLVDSGTGQVLTLQASVFINAVPLFLPVLKR